VDFGDELWVLGLPCHRKTVEVARAEKFLVHFVEVPVYPKEEVLTSFLEEPQNTEKAYLLCSTMHFESNF
jgi:hypothetical protein